MTGKNVKILVIIPAYQEEQTIRSVVENLIRIGRDVLVINDGSWDRTAEMAMQGGAKVITLPVNSGYGTALQTGYRFAWRHRYDCVVQMDADGQHDAAYLQELLQPVLAGEADLTIGSRFKQSGSYKVPGIRRLGMQIFSAILNILTKQKFTDPTSGFQAMNRRTLKYFTSDAFPRDYPDADMLLTAFRAGLKIMEIPVTMHASKTGKSMHGGFIKPIYYIFRMMLGITVSLLRKPPNVQLQENE
ncbi:glycosyltransferase family 2 protein [bacterium]|nr:glycosyltransferase family 2 protein [candidate division CSSED10-310 bacterium]